MRLYTVFIGPLNKGAPWSTDGMPGVYRFLARVYRLYTESDGAEDPDRPRAFAAGEGTDAQRKLLAKTIDRVTTDCESLNFNTAISQLMVFVRDIEKEQPMPLAIARQFLLLLAPLGPHLAEELWRGLGNQESLAYEPWPEADPALLIDDQVEVAVQVQGKMRGKITVDATAEQDAVFAAALEMENVRKHVGEKAPRRVIYIQGRLLNIVL